MKKQPPREADHLRSRARRTGDGSVEAMVALDRTHVPPGPYEVRLKAGKRTRTTQGTVADDGLLGFTVPQRGLGRSVWRVAVRPEGVDGRFTRVQARLLAVPGRPVAMLTGPEPTTRLAPPAPPAPPAPAAPAARTARFGVRRVRSLASRARGALRQRGDASRVRPVPPLGGTGRTTPLPPHPPSAVTTATRPPAEPDTPGPGADTGPDTGTGTHDASGHDTAERKRKGKGKGRKGSAAPARLSPKGELRDPLSLIGTQDLSQVVVICDPASRRRADKWTRWLAPAEVLQLVVIDDEPDEALGNDSAATARPGVTIHLTSSQEEVMGHLQQLPRVDLVVSTLGEHADGSWPDTGHVLMQAFPYLRRGGSYFQDRTAEPDDSGPLPRWWADLASAPPRDNARQNQSRESELLASVGSLVVTPKLVISTSRKRHYLKLRESQVPDLLRQREPDLEVDVIATRPAGTLVPATREQTYGPRSGEPWPEVLEYPEIAVRHYRGDIHSGGGMLLFTGSTVLPESFRWPMSAEFDNRRCLSSGEVAQIKKHFLPTEGSPVLPGTYFHLDSAYSGHFGHVTTETISRLWAWDEAKRQIPDLKAFYYTRPDKTHRTLERVFFRAYGIADDDIVSVDHPVTLESVVGASPLWHNAAPYYVHPDIRETWARLSSGLGDGPPAEHERIFVARGPTVRDRRGCRNAAEVEAVFAAHGFHVFYPEEMSMARQVALFAGARVVAGYGGSAMANLMHTRRLETTIVLSHGEYAARNEHLYTSLLGGEFHYFWAAPDEAAEDEEDMEGATDGLGLAQSSWEFDFARYGDDLRRVLSGC